jgi:mercuric ion transport protein
MNMKYLSKRATFGSSISPVTQWFRMIFLIGIWLFIACLLIQVFLAGMAVFMSRSWWTMHIMFAHIIGVLTLILLAAVFLGRFPRKVWELTVLIAFLLLMQGITIHLSRIPNLSLTAAFHPVNALLMFWVATATGWKSWRIVNSQTSAVPDNPHST